jgi:glucose/arabinose dehydrogenase
MIKEGWRWLVAIVLGLCATTVEIRAKTNTSNRFVPVLRPFSEENLEKLKVPPGFRINVFATGQGNARMMLLIPDGTILLTRYDIGEVVALRDLDNDGVAESAPVVANIPLAHGLAYRDNTVYLASETKLYRMPVNGNGTFGAPTAFADLPPGGLHPRRTIGFDDAGWLYVSIGSSCNNCAELGSPEYAALVRMRPDGAQRTVFARGLRNMLGFDWHPVTGQLWGMDNGSDDRGDLIPPEELNLIREGADYGWPSCYARRKTDKITAQDPLIPLRDCRETTPMTRGYPAHSAPIAFVFYRATQFPAAYRNNAFFAVHGSWNRLRPSGYKVVRVRFANGKPMGFQDFVSGWLIEKGRAQFGRPAGLVVAQDGSLLISDDNNGVIYRVSRKARNQRSLPLVRP